MRYEKMVRVNIENFFKEICCAQEQKNEAIAEGKQDEEKKLLKDERNYSMFIYKWERSNKGSKGEHAGSLEERWDSVSSAQDHRQFIHNKRKEPQGIGTEAD